MTEAFFMAENDIFAADWQSVTIDEIAIVRGGNAFSHKHQGKIEGRYPFYKVSDMNSPGNELFMKSANNYVDESVVLEIRAKPFPRYTIVFPKVGAAVHTNKKRILASEALIDNNVMGVIVKDEKRCDPLFLLFWFMSINLTDFSNPGPLPSITGRSVKDAVIRLPDLNEQRAIARVLMTIQKAKEATEKVIAATKELKKSLMKYLFTYGPVPIDEAEHVPLKETEIGPIPAHWAVTKLKDMAEKTDSISLKKNPGLEFRYIDVSGISSENLQIQTFSIHRIESAPSRARKTVRTGDTIFATVRPYLRRVALVPNSLDGEVCSTAFCVIRPSVEKVDPNYLFHAVSSEAFVRRVSEHQRGSSYPAVTDKDVLNESIPLPPVEEQQAIRNAIGSVDAKVRTECRRKEALGALFTSMLHQLMTGQLRVKELDI